MTAMKSSAHRPSDPFLGVTVLDDYRVVAHLRAEPRGDTYRALPQHTGTPVQVKLLAHSLPRDNTARATWARVWGQAERMPRLDHPNVERVLDCGLVRVDGAERFCVVTELLDGESLQAHVHARGRFAVDEVLTIGQQVAQGLAAAHRVGLVHGDLRATNVTLVGHASNDGSDARVVLCDLGLTNLLLAGLGSSHTLGEMLCSPESIAPEQIRGEPTTPATDVYAFGVVLYRLLTGLSPFHADNTTQMLRAHLTRPVPQMRDRCHALEVPPVLEALVRRCLAKRQEDRPQSIDTLLAGLQECEATVLSMSAPGTPSWVTPRNAASLPARARAEADRPARILVENVPDVVAPVRAPHHRHAPRGRDPDAPAPDRARDPPRPDAERVGHPRAHRGDRDRADARSSAAPLHPPRPRRAFARPHHADRRRVLGHPCAPERPAGCPRGHRPRPHRARRRERRRAVRRPRSPSAPPRAPRLTARPPSPSPPPRPRSRRCTPSSRGTRAPGRLHRHRSSRSPRPPRPPRPRRRPRSTWRCAPTPRSRPSRCGAGPTPSPSRSRSSPGASRR